MDGIGEAFEHTRFIRAADQAGRNIASVVAVDGDDFIVPLVKFVELPLGRIAMEMGQAFPRKGCRTCRQEQLHAFNQDALVFRVAADVEPQNCERERGVDRRLGFLLVHSQDRKSSLPLAQDPARVDGAERTLEVHGVAQFRGRESGEVALQRSPQLLLIGGTGDAASCRRAMVLTAADFQFRGPRVPKLLHHEPQAAIADFGVQNPPDGIPFRRPQVKQAFVVFAGDRVLRVGKVEDPGAVF